MLFSVEGKQITKVAHKREFHQRMKNLQKGDYRAIIDELIELLIVKMFIPQAGFQGRTGEVHCMNQYGLHVEKIMK